MQADLLSASRAEAILTRELGGHWTVSDTLGTMRATRLAVHGSRTVVVKLTTTPAAILGRLSELEVTPAIITTGIDLGDQFMVQEAVQGPHPDHAWYLAHRHDWAAMIKRYLDDAQLHKMVSTQPAFWRLSVPSAVELIDGDLRRAHKDSPALDTDGFRTTFDDWRRQAESIPQLPMRPIHPDAHWHNYVVVDDAPLLLDWDHIDLSDPFRDVGAQIWGFLPPQHWPEFLHGVGLPTGPEHGHAVYWWAAFKALSNALFNDTQHDPAGAAFHVGLFTRATEQRPWIGGPD